MLFFCTVILGCAFLLPKNSKAANAAAVTPNAVTYRLDKVCLYDNIGDSVTVGTTTPNGTVDGGLDVTLTDKKLYGHTSTARAKARIAYATIAAEIVVPAYTEYTVAYSWSIYFIIGSYKGYSGVTEILYYGETDTSDTMSYNVVSGASGTCEQQTTFLLDASSAAMSGTKTDSMSDITYNNDTSNAKTYTAYFGFFVGGGRTGVSGISQDNQATVTFSDAVTISPAQAPTLDGSSTKTEASFTYDATDHNFTFEYGADYSALTSVVKQPFDGTPTTIYSYDTATHVSTGTNPIVSGSAWALQEAGVYTVTFDILGGSMWADNNGNETRTFTITINRKPISAPTVLDATKDYKAAEYEFGLSGYDKDLMSVSSQTSNNGSTITWDSTAEKFKATDAAEYTVKFHMDSPNHIWTSGGTETATDQSKTIKINKKELTITTTPSAVPSPSWDYGESGTITVNVTAGGIASPDFVLDTYYIKNGDTSNPITTGFNSDGTQLDVSQVAAGNYELCIALTSAAANKNYSISGGVFKMPFTINAGDVDLNALTVQYTKTSTGNDKTAVPSGGLVYSYDSATNTEEEYKFYLDFTALPYLTDDGYTYRYSGATAIVDGYKKSGTAEVTAKLKLADPTDTNHSLPDSFSVDAPFKAYTKNSDGTATIVFEVLIDKAVANISGADIPLVYQFAGEQKKDYDPDDPPQCKDNIPVFITVGAKSRFPHGVDSVTFDDATVTETAAGNYVIDATVTLTDDYKNAGGGNTVRVQIPWKLSKQIIKLDWTDVQITEPGVTQHFVKNLNNLSDEQKRVIKYVYYNDVGGAPDTTPLTETQFYALCTNDRYTDPVWLWVEAVIDTNISGYEKFELEANPVLNPVRFKLGRNMTLINVTTSGLDGLVYGGNLDKDNALKFTDKDGGVWNRIFYELHVYKDGVDLGLFDDFDFTTADAGENYKIEVVMTPSAINSNNEEIYALDTGKSIPFTISPKAIALPEIGVMQFNGSEQSIESILGGSYAEYKDIIQLSNDLQKRNVGTYTTVLTITNPNYKWAQPSVQPTKLSLTDGEITLTDDVTAQCSWSIAPMVVNTSKLWNKSKDGATLNLPDNIKAFIDAGTLEVGYKYYDAAGQFIESPELKGGKSFKVEAVFAGTDAELGNIVFEKSNGALGAVSEGVDYTVPQSGAAAFFGNALSFFKSNWLWFLIGFLILLFLIILICVIVHRRKTKEEREAKKEAKEEEKRRKEEEREEEKRRREQERELEKAKAEAELAKMRTGMGLGAGAAGLAMAAQQPQQMPMQQPQYVQQPVTDPNALARIEAEIAAMRAEHRMQQQPQYMPQAMPQMMPMPMPMQMQTPMYGGGQQYAQPQSAGGGMSEAEMRARIAEDRMFRSAEQRAIIAEERLRSGSGSGNSNITVQPAYAPAEDNQRAVNNSKTNNADMFGAVLASMFRSLSEGKPHKKPEALPVVQTESDNVSINTPTVYPPDAVITTTTTVDTTKPKPELSRDSERNFDIDGFYDTFDPNKHDV